MTTNWLPIETAPKDGTEILATGLDHGEGPTRHTVIARWEDYCFMEEEGEEELAYLTHWMPIPDPPTNQTTV